MPMAEVFPATGTFLARAVGGNRGGFNLFGVVRTLGLGAQTIWVLTLGFAALELALLLLSAYGVWKLKHWGLNLAMLVVVFVLIGAMPGLFAGGRLFNLWRFAANLLNVSAAVGILALGILPSVRDTDS